MIIIKIDSSIYTICYSAMVGPIGTTNVEYLSSYN